MKKGIHPKYQSIVATCVCGAKIQTGSTLESIRVDICSKCHPLFTGEQKILDTEGRVEKFKKKYQVKEIKKEEPKKEKVATKKK